MLRNFLCVNVRNWRPELSSRWTVVLLSGILIFISYMKVYTGILTVEYDGIPEHSRENYDIRRQQWCEALDLSKKSLRRHRLPDVIGIGIQKCGTGAIDSFLQLHPYIRALDQEAKFFSNEWTESDLEKYRLKLPDGADHELVMEKSPPYFSSSPDNLPTLMHELMPNLKIIIILCNPVQRTLSCFAMKQQNGNLTKKTFDSFITQEFNSEKPENQEIFSTAEELKYKDCITEGIYKNNMERWMKEFKDSLVILDGEEFLTNPGSAIEELQDFLQIPKLLREEDFFRNEITGMFCVKQWWEDEIANILPEKKTTENSLQKHTYCLPPKKGRTRSKITTAEFTMSNETRTILINYFRPFNEIFFKMIGKTYNW